MKKFINLEQFVTDQICKYNTDFNIEQFNGGTATSCINIDTLHKNGLQILIIGNTRFVVTNYRAKTYNKPAEFILTDGYFEGTVEVLHENITLYFDLNVLIKL